MYVEAIKKEIPAPLWFHCLHQYYSSNGIQDNSPLVIPLGMLITRISFHPDRAKVKCWNFQRDCI